MGAQVIEVMRFPEEFRVVGRDRVDEILDLTIIARKQIAVFGERRQPEDAQPARKPAVQKVPLALAQRDSGILVGKLHEMPEIGFREREFATCTLSGPG